jgi:hypothetical protein
VIYWYLGAANSNLLTDSYRRCQTTCRVAWHCHGAQERHLYRFRHVSSKQAHGVLHGGRIAREDDPATIACEAELLLGHPQVLLEDPSTEVCQWHLEPLSVSRVHHTVALACHRGTVLIGFQSWFRSEVLFPRETIPCHLLAIRAILLVLIMVSYFFLSFWLLGTWELAELRILCFCV